MFKDTFSENPSDVMASLAGNVLVSCFPYHLACHSFLLLFMFSLASLVKTLHPLPYSFFVFLENCFSIEANMVFQNVSGVRFKDGNN